MTTTTTTTTTMKAITQRAYGATDALSLDDIERPGIADDEVLVRVRASSVNQADWVYLTGTPLIARLAFGLRRPKNAVRGKDLSGQVEAVGSAVTRFQPGDEVYAEVEAGGFAQYAAVPERLLALKPANLTFEQAATVPLAARTALQGIRDGGKVQPGQSVLINGASGGVGTFAVQIAKALGAEVTAVVSTRNAELVRSLGADHVIDYTRDDFTRQSVRYDVIFDLIGNHPLGRLRRSLARRGTLVLSSGSGSRVFGPMGRIIGAIAVSALVSQKLGIFPAVIGWQALGELRELIEAGKVTPAIDRVFPLHEVPDAIRYLVHEHARGKIVITV